MLSSCSVDKFKSQLDNHLRNLSDLPCQPGYNNSLDGGDCLNGGHYADALAANYLLGLVRLHLIGSQGIRAVTSI